MDPRLYMLAGTFALLVVALVATIMSAIRASRRSWPEPDADLITQPEWPAQSAEPAPAGDNSLEGFELEVPDDSPYAALLAPLRTGSWQPPDEPAPAADLTSVSLDARVASFEGTTRMGGLDLESVPLVREPIAFEPIAPELPIAFEPIAPEPSPMIFEPFAPEPAMTVEPIAPEPSPMTFEPFAPEAMDVLATREEPSTPEQVPLGESLESMWPEVSSESSLAVPHVSTEREEHTLRGPMPDWAEQVPLVVDPMVDMNPTLQPVASQELSQSAAPFADDLDQQAPEPLIHHDDASWDSFFREQVVVSEPANQPILPMNPAPVVEPEPELAQATEGVSSSPSPGVAPSSSVVPPEPAIEVGGTQAPSPAPEVVAESRLRPRAVVRSIESVMADTPQYPAYEPLAPVTKPEASASARSELIEIVMAAPVEMWIGDSRIGVKAGTRTYEQFKKYADVLFADLRSSKS